MSLFLLWPMPTEVAGLKSHTQEGPLRIASSIAGSTPSHLLHADAKMISETLPTSLNGELQ